MLVLSEHGTYRSFTDAELDRLGVSPAMMENFLRSVLVHLLKDYGFYPPQQEVAYVE